MYTFGMKSEVGNVRQVNEDAIYLQTASGKPVIALVADGMGGHKAGDIASQIAIETLKSEMAPLTYDVDLPTAKGRLMAAIHKANRAIYDFAQTSPDYHGMGTTVVGLVLVEKGLVVGHIGDSRAYRFCQGQLKQLTQDHSLVEELLKKGQISLDEADRHPHKHILMRALGTERQIEADLLDEPWQNQQEKEIFLLCTDGLSNLVDAAEIKAVLSADLSAQEQVEQLVKKALDNGGDDNISVIIIHRN